MYTYFIRFYCQIIFCCNGYIIVYLSIHQLIGIWVVSTLAIMNDVAMNICEQDFMSTCVFISLGYLGVGLWVLWSLYVFGKEAFGSRHFTSAASSRPAMGRE